MGLEVLDTTSDSQLRCRETVLVSGLTVDNSDHDLNLWSLEVTGVGTWGLKGFEGFVGFV